MKLHKSRAKGKFVIGAAISRCLRVSTTMIFYPFFSSEIRSFEILLCQELKMSVADKCAEGETDKRTDGQDKERY